MSCPRGHRIRFSARWRLDAGIGDSGRLEAIFCGFRRIDALCTFALPRFRKYGYNNDRLFVKFAWILTTELRDEVSEFTSYEVIVQIATTAAFWIKSGD